MVFKCWVSILITTPPRLVRYRPGRIDYLLYTDASYENHQGFIAAVLFDPESYRLESAIRADYVLRTNEVRQVIDLFGGPSPIFGLELTAVTVAVFQLRYLLMNRPITIFVDNNAVLGAFAKGSSKVDISRSFVSTFWWVASMFSISIWLGRVSSASNCADAPSRNRALPFAVSHDCSFDSLQEWLSIQGEIFSDTYGGTRSGRYRSSTEPAGPSDSRNNRLTSTSEKGNQKK